MTDDKLPIKKEQLTKVAKYLVFAGVGAALLIIGGTFSSSSEEVKESKVSQAIIETPAVVTISDQITHDETALENRVSEILSTVAGVGRVQVRVNLASTSEQEYALNANTNRRTTQEKDPEGAVRTISETTDQGQIVMEHGSGSGAENPILTKAHKPQISGVLVVAEGAKDYQMKLNITRTVETLLGIPAHKISVQPMEK